MQNISSFQRTLKKYEHPQRHIPQVPKRLFSATPAYMQTRYEDLDSFRQEIEASKAGLHHQPYTSNRRSVTFYRLIFLGFTLLFFGLGITVMSMPAFQGCHLFISTCTLLKGIAASVCACLSLSSLAIALTLRAEKEAVLQCARKTRAQLATVFARKRVKLGIKRFFTLFGQERQQASSLRSMYHEALEKVSDIKDEAMHLVNRISTANTLDAVQKEMLLNQAVEEMNEKMRVLVRSFKHAASPYFTE